MPNTIPLILHIFQMNHHCSVNQCGRVRVFIESWDVLFKIVLFAYSKTIFNLNLLNTERFSTPSCLFVICSCLPRPYPLEIQLHSCTLQVRFQATLAPLDILPRCPVLPVSPRPAVTACVYHAISGPSLCCINPHQAAIKGCHGDRLNETCVCLSRSFWWNAICGDVVEDEADFGRQRSVWSWLFSKPPWYASRGYVMTHWGNDWEGNKRM